MRLSTVLAFGFLFTSSAFCLQLPEVQNSNGFIHDGVPDPLFHLQRLGFPSNNSLRFFENYVLSYDARLRLASWVFEHLTARSVAKNDNLTVNFSFKEDKSIPVQFRARDSDYKRNNLNMTRGHLAAAANHQIFFLHKQNTYTFSNIAPQIGSGFNSGMWSTLETWVRNLAFTHSEVFVITGPLFLPTQDDEGEFVTYRLLGNNRIAVPTHFFKVVLTEDASTGRFRRWTFVLPHEKIQKGSKLDSFLANASVVEKDSGLLFFEKVPASKIVTQTTTTRKYFFLEE